MLYIAISILSLIYQQVRYWDKPLITVGGMAKDFSDLRHTTYNMITRAGPAVFSNLVVALSHIVSYYKWTKLIILYNPTESKHIFEMYCHLCAEAIHHNIKDLGIKNPTPAKDIDDPEKELLTKVGNVYGGRSSQFT